MSRVSSGMEWYFGKVRITALSPSVTLRNYYSTYGVDMNNASIVLRFENCDKDVVSIESLRYEGSRDKQIEKKAGAGVVTRVLTTDGSYENEYNTPFSHQGTIVAVVPPGKKPVCTKLKDKAGEVFDPPETV